MVVWNCSGKSPSDVANLKKVLEWPHTAAEGGHSDDRLGLRTVVIFLELAHLKY